MRNRGRCIAGCNIQLLYRSPYTIRKRHLLIDWLADHTTSIQVHEIIQYIPPSYWSIAEVEVVHRDLPSFEWDATSPC